MTFPFVHLHVHSCYSFLDGASEPEALVRRAAELGMPALALTDHDSVAGAVRFSSLCRQYGVQPVLGSEVTLEDGSHPHHLTLLAETRAGYANLCRLLSLSYACGGRRTPALPWERLGEFSGGLLCLTGCRKGRVTSLVREHRYEEAIAAGKELLDIFGRDRLFVELQDDLTPSAERTCRMLAALAERLNVPTVATNNVHYAEPEGFVAHDLLRCIGAGVTLSTPHPLRPLNRERHLKSAWEMSRLFEWCPEAIATTVEIAERCGDVLPCGEDITPRHDADDATAHLRRLALSGARDRYGSSPSSVRQKVRDRLDHELSIINGLGFADYLLLCHDIVRWARSEAGIRCTGRGSAADSCVAYCLRLTDVDVIERGLPFARFLLPGKTPDVDCDFPSDRRDEVFRHIQTRYGENHVGMACTFFTYHAKSAVRDVGKALALPPDVLEFFSERLYHHLSATDIEAAFDNFEELKDHRHLTERFKTLFDLCGRIAGFPRHIGTHSSGVLISRVPLTDVAPLIPSAKGILPIWTLDKDDSETVGGIKFDVLALRILSSVADAEREIKDKDSAFDYDSLPLDDPATYRLLQSGKGVGTFQFESAAQLALSVELLPETFEDLTAAVALIRPANSSNSGRSGKNSRVRASTVRQYLDARSGYQRADCFHPCLRALLSRTFGVIIFQEQVDLTVAAMTGWDEVESERFRKSLTRHTKNGTLAEAGQAFVDAVLAHRPETGKTRAYAIWSQIQGWGGYGFIEGHAASFALTGYKTAYLSVHHTAEFIGGLINHQPMGFYPANSLVAEARRRGVGILPVDVNASDDRCGTNGQGGLRLGLRLVSGLGEADRAAIAEAREEKGGGPFLSLLDFCVRVVPPLRRDRLENLILCGAFDALPGHGHHLNHRRGLVLALDDTLSLASAYRQEATEAGQQALPFGAWKELAADIATPCVRDVPDFSAWERFQWAWRITGVAADCHPLAWLRPRLDKRGVLTCAEAALQPPGSVITVAGLNIRPHRPPTRSGKRVLFTTVEDETDFLQAAVTDDETLQQTTATLLLAPAVLVKGAVEQRGKGVALIVQQAKPLRWPEL